jgi:hypothetical protein
MDGSPAREGWETFDGKNERRKRGRFIVAEPRNMRKNAQAVFLAFNRSFHSSPVEVGFNSLGETSFIRRGRIMPT